MDGVNELEERKKAMANTLPTTMEYFDNLLGEQLTEGGGSGGGGSSDFSTAELTVNVPSRSGVFHGFRIYGAFIDSYESEDYSIGSIRISSQGTHAITLILYKGVAYMSFDVGITPTTEGLIAYDEDMGMYKVTGDCTITIS